MYLAPKSPTPFNSSSNKPQKLTEDQHDLIPLTMFLRHIRLGSYMSTAELSEATILVQGATRQIQEMIPSTISTEVKGMSC